MDSCRPDNSTDICNQHGDCVCGHCQCTDQYLGEFCQCRYDSCPFIDGKVWQIMESCAPGLTSWNFLFPFVKKLYPPVWGRGIAIRVGKKLIPACQSRFEFLLLTFRHLREIRKICILSYSLSLPLSNYFFPSSEGNWVIKNCQLALERGRKLISVTQNEFCVQFQ